MLQEGFVRCHQVIAGMLFNQEDPVLEMKNAVGLQAAFRIQTVWSQLVKIGDRFQTDLRLVRQRL